MKFNLGRRVRAVKAAYALGRVETADEMADREDAERKAENAAWLKRRVAESFLGVHFPGDEHGVGSGSTWIPRFFEAGRRDDW